MAPTRPGGRGANTGHGVVGPERRDTRAPRTRRDVQHDVDAVGYQVGGVSPSTTYTGTKQDKCGTWTTVSCNTRVRAQPAIASQSRAVRSRLKRKYYVVCSSRGERAAPIGPSLTPKQNRQGGQRPRPNLGPHRPQPPSSRPPRARHRHRHRPPSPHTTLNATGLGANGIARRGRSGYRSRWSGWLPALPPFWALLRIHSTPLNAWDARARPPPPQQRLSARRSSLGGPR